MNLIYQSSNYNPVNPLILDILIQTKKFFSLCERIRQDKKRARGQKRIVLSSPRRTTTHNPKTNIDAAVGEIAVVAISRTAIVRIVGPRTTAQQSCISILFNT